MKTHTDYIYLTTKNEREIVNITREVENIVQASGRIHPQTHLPSPPCLQSPFLLE